MEVAWTESGAVEMVMPCSFDIVDVVAAGRVDDTLLSTTLGTTEEEVALSTAGFMGSTAG